MSLQYNFVLKEKLKKKLYSNCSNAEPLKLLRIRLKFITISEIKFKKKTFSLPYQLQWKLLQFQMEWTFLIYCISIIYKLQRAGVTSDLNSYFFLGGVGGLHKSKIILDNRLKLFSWWNAQFCFKWSDKSNFVNSDCRGR